MIDKANSFTQIDFQRRAPGKRAGCSCCTFTMMGLLSVPLLLVVALFIAF